MFRHHRKLALALCVLALCTVFARRSAAAPAASQPPIGTNISGVVDWTTEMPFVDVFKTARRWLPQCISSDPGCTDRWDTGEYPQLDLDANGWVRSLPAPSDAPIYTRVATIMLLGNNIEAFEGEYVVLYDGEGTIEYVQGASKNVGASRPGRDVVNLNATGLFQLIITATDPNRTGNYIRNIRVVRSQHESTYQSQVFNPVFLEKLSPFSAIRYMDFMVTNDSAQQEWANRPRPTDYTYSCYQYFCKGVPVEVMVALSNRTHTAPWFTLPHKATDEYMAEFARIVRDSLAGDLPVYIEYSNEVWNTIFDQGTWVEQQGVAAWPGGSASGFTKRINWHAKRTVEMCQQWKSVWGAQSDRVVCVAGGMAANSWINTQILSCPLWSGGPCAERGIDALAIAPYFGGYIGSPQAQATVQSWLQQPDGGLSTLFDEITTGGRLGPQWNPANGALNQSFGWMTENRTIANQYGVDLLAYEGGQHLAGTGGVENDNAITNLLTQANRDPRMGTAYTTYLNGWKSRGGQLFMNFSLSSAYTKWGSWGALEYISQPGSPKYDALKAFIAANAPTTATPATATSTRTATASATRTATATSTRTATATSTRTTTATSTSQAPATATRTVTATSTSQAPATATRTVTSQAPATATPVPPNLLRNAGFELDANNDGRPDVWFAHPLVTRSSAARHGGSYSMRHRATANSTYIVGQTVSVSPGQSYLAQAWTNIPPTGDDFVYQVEVAWRDAQNVIVKVDSVRVYTAATTGWTVGRRTLVAPPGAVKASVRMNVTGLATTIYADDFIFRRAP